MKRSIGCFDNSGVFYDVGSEWYLVECEFFYCESPGTWSAINVIDNCLGCFDDFGVFYDLGSEIFVVMMIAPLFFAKALEVWSNN